MVGCEYRKHCYLKDLDCYFATRYHCLHKDSIDFLRLEKQRKSKEITDRVEEDTKLQMEIGCI